MKLFSKYDALSAPNKVIKIPANKYPAILSLIKDDVNKNCSQVLFIINNVKNKQIKILLFFEVFNSKNNKRVNQ